MKVRKSLSISVCLFIATGIGCRLGVPIHAWIPPAMESAVGTRVVLAEIAGPQEIAEDLQTRLLSHAPQDSGRKLTLLPTHSLQDDSKIQLTTGHADETSDVVLASVARRQGYDYVLRGEILGDQQNVPREGRQKRLTVSWKLFALGDRRSVGGIPLVVDVPTAIERYPDLRLLTSEDEVLRTAIVRDTYRLITPSVARDRVQLGIPYFLPGSKQVRRGNIAAAKGLWGEAERIWSDVIESHPSQVAAIHNLALAAAAKQDFSRGKELARKAVRRRPTKLQKETLVWIETRQRDYHEAFNLPDPPEGWFVTSE